MDGELLTRVTIWVALVAYAAADLGRRGVWDIGERRARGLWAVGCGLYLLHVTAAFTAFYGWSHATAYDRTAAQTAAVIGLDWGGGIFVNYAFTMLWVTETLWWWLAPVHYRHRRPWVETTVRLTFLFMILNGAVIFVDGPQSFLGVAIVVLLAATWRGPRPGRAKVRPRG